MYRYKNIISNLLILLLIISFGNVSLADTGNDKIDWLVDKEFVVGDGRGNLNLNGVLTREEAATIIVKALGKESLAPLYQNIENKFKDMNTAIWSNGMINVAVEEKIVAGYPDSTFRPKSNITYQEIIVMLVQVKGGLSEAERTSAAWPTPYVLKADELGILDGVQVDKLDANISRLKAFEMLYNTVAQDVIDEEEGEFQTYTALVTEVDRVYPINKNELGLIVMESADGNKYKVNDYTRVTFTNISDYENLLGKVVKVRLDDGNNVKGYEINNSYEYLQGKVEFKKDEVIVNGKTYDLGLTGNTNKANEKLHFVYHNDKSISYADLVNKEESNFARITLNRGMVIAIESFGFSLVEPIEKIDGNRVRFIQGDNIVMNRVLSLKDNNFATVKLEDVKGSVIGHVYDSDKMIVIENKEVVGKLDNVLSQSGGQVLVRIDGKDHTISNKFNLLYSTSGAEFIELTPEKAYDDLYELRGQEIGYALDISGNIKYVISSRVSNEDFYIVDRTLTRDLRLFDSKGNLLEMEIDLRSTLKNANGKSIELKDLNAGDLVYIQKDGKYIESLTLVNNLASIKNQSKKVEKDASGNFVIDRRYAVNSDAISFLFLEDGNQLREVKGLEVEEIFASASLDSDLKVFMLSDYDFDQLGLSKKVITSGNQSRINLLIFTGFKPTLEGTREEIVRLRYLYRPNYNKDIEGYIGEELTKIKVEENTKLPSLEVGDYVRVYINGNGEIIRGELLFKDADPFVGVTKLDSRAGKLLEITVLEDGKEKTYEVSSEQRELGVTRVGSQVKLHFNKSGEVDVILVK